MNSDFSKIAPEILELSSEQRLAIIEILSKHRSKLTEIVKELSATTSEVHRNLSRLSKAKIISKDIDGYFLTSYGEVLYSQISTWKFFSQHKQFFTKHQMGELPKKFSQRLGALSDSQSIKGFVKVQNTWKKIYENAEKYIYNILYEVPYEMELLKLIKLKSDQGVKFKTIFSTPIIVSDNRKELLSKTGLFKILKQDIIERKIRKNTSVLVVLNEKEACVNFPSSDGSIDVSELLYGKSEMLHEWCFDYFQHCWQNSSPFREDLISK